MKQEKTTTHKTVERENYLLNDTVNFRLNKFEKLLIKRQAEKMRMSPSTFIRFAFLNLLKTYHNENK